MNAEAMSTNASVERVGALERLEAEGCIVFDLPRLAFATRWTEYQKRLASVDLRVGDDRLSVDPYGAFDAIWSDPLDLSSILCSLPESFDAEFARCCIAGPYVRKSVLMGFARRFRVDWSMGDASASQVVDARMRQICVDWLCFARPVSEAGPLRIATCSLDTVIRRVELARAIGCPVAIELVPLNDVVRAWRSDRAWELSRSSNILQAAGVRVQVEQVQDRVRRRSSILGRTPDPSEWPYMGVEVRFVDHLKAMLWSQVQQSLDTDVDSPIREDLAIDGDLEVRDPTNADESSARVVQRLLLECFTAGIDWLEIAQKGRSVMLRYGGIGWSLLRREISDRHAPAIHARLAAMARIAPESGGRGRIEIPLSSDRTMIASVWLPQRRELSSSWGMSLPIAQIRMFGQARAASSSDALITSIVASHQAHPAARIIIISSESEWSVREFGQGLRSHTSFSHMPYIEFAGAQKAASAPRMGAAEVVDSRCGSLARCEPAIASVIALTEVRSTEEVDEILRIALSGSYVLLRIPATNVEAAVLRFLNWTSHRPLAVALLLASAHLDELTLSEMAVPWTCDVSGANQIRRLRRTSVMNLTTACRERLANSTAPGAVDRHGIVTEHLEHI
jgi:hypothetical protein